MKQKRTKPKPILSKSERGGLTGDEWERLDVLDWVGDINRAKHKKSEKYLSAGELADKFKARKL